MNIKKYPSTYVAADILVVKRIPNGGESVLLIQRKNEPFKGSWALPGGYFDHADLDVKHGAIRELHEEANIQVTEKQLSLIGVYSRKNRDPRENSPTDPSRIVSVAFKLILTEEPTEIKAGDDAAAFRFFSFDALPDLAFDHAEIIRDGLAK